MRWVEAVLLLGGTALVVVGCTGAPEPTTRPTGTGSGGDSGEVPDSGEGGDSGLDGPMLEAIAGVPSLEGLPTVGMPVDAAVVLDSGFGPRRMSSEDYRTDFHTGIDLDAERGSPVVAVADGTVARVSAEDGEGGSNSVMVRHSLLAPVSFHGEWVEEWFARYDHLDTIGVEVDQLVEAGEALGTLGDTGSATEPHLHFEARLGTWCSLRFALANPESDCARDYDPAVNPLHLLPVADLAPLDLEVVDLDPLSLRVTVLEGDFDLNVVRTDEHALDFDLRLGLDPSSVETLDDLELDWITIDPAHDADEELVQSYLLTFHEAPAWVEVVDIRGAGLRLTP